MVNNNLKLVKENEEERLAKYMEWGKGLVQKKEKEEKFKDDLYEADKPLARYRNDQDLDKLLKSQERTGLFIFITVFPRKKTQGH